MKRRINNLHKGMFKGNKTSNIIELHSKKRPQEKENLNLNISQYKYINNDNNNNNNISKKDFKSKNNEQNKNNSPNKKEKVMNIYNNSFSDSDSSNNKSMIKTKLYNKYTKSGTYFKRLRQQVIDKFISGKPLISIERMYNNPEVKKMFGIQNNTEKTNYQTNNSYNNDEDNMSIEEQRDRRIPPSKFIPLPIPNIAHNNIQIDKNYNNNLNEISNINDTEEIFSNNYNTMIKINQNYYRNHNQNLNVNRNNMNIFANNNNKYINDLLYKQQRISNLNNSRFMSTNDINDINSINNNSERDPYEFDVLQDMNGEYRRKRMSNNEQSNYMVHLNEINEESNEYNNNYYKNDNNEYNEVEDINKLLNNLKNENNNNRNYNIFSYASKDNDSYFNKLLIKKDKENNFINYLNNQQSIMETSEQNNDIRFDTPTKK